MNNKKIFDLAIEYLFSFPEITPKMLAKQCLFPGAPKSKNALFKSFLVSAPNRQGMFNSIGDIDNLKNILFDFDSDKVMHFFQTWDMLFDKIESTYSPPGRMIKTNPHNYWVIFCKSILSIAKYLNRFPSIESFNSYVKEFISSNTDIRLALPLLLKEELFGFKFALACDFIKENISPEFIKPDVHIKDIFIGVGLSKKDANDFEIFRNVIDFSRSINELPYKVDKVFWLIGSGNFYYEKISIKTDKYAFIDKINNENCI